MKSLTQFFRAPLWLAFALFLVVCTAVLPASAGGASYRNTIITSNIGGWGAFQDSNLQNPWGISFSSTGDFWLADNADGLSTLYIGSGAPQALVVTIPGPAGAAVGAPTGTVFNGSTDFKVGGLPGIFLFAGEDGVISGWNGIGASAIVAVDNSGVSANYKGMELANNGANHLYFANFFSGTVDVFDKNFQPVTLSGTFSDPTIPAGYAPFNIRNIGGSLYVMYALQNSTKSDADFCTGCGLVDVFDLNGNFIKRLVSGGVLNAPWGIAQAPSNFGTFSNMVLVGNLGDGRMSAFDPSTGAFKGQIKSNGKVVSVPGLWALTFGNGGSAGKTNELFYTAGTISYVDGAFGKITAAQ
jgi:uncharacterized protein (TIGR03118 family)